MKSWEPGDCGCCGAACDYVYLQTATGVPAFDGDDSGGSNWTEINAGDVFTAEAFEVANHEDRVWIGWGTATGTVLAVHDETLPTGDVVQFILQIERNPGTAFPPNGTEEFSAGDEINIGDILFFANPSTGSGWHVRMTWDVTSIGVITPYDIDAADFKVTVTDPNGVADTTTHELFGATNLGLDNLMLQLAIEIRGDNVSIWIGDQQDVAHTTDRRDYCVWSEDILSGDRPGTSWGVKQVSGVTYYTGPVFGKAVFKVAAASSLESQTEVATTDEFLWSDYCDNCATSYDTLGPSPLTGRVEIAISGYPTASYTDPSGRNYNLISADPNGTATYGPTSTAATDVPCGAPSIYVDLEWEMAHPLDPTNYGNVKSPIIGHSKFKDTSGNALSVIDRYVWRPSNNSGGTGPIASVPFNMDALPNPDDWQLLTSPRRFYKPPRTTGILTPFDKATITIKGVV